MADDLRAPTAERKSAGKIEIRLWPEGAPRAIADVGLESAYLVPQGVAADARDRQCRVLAFRQLDNDNASQ